MCNNCPQTPQSAPDTLLFLVDDVTEQISHIRSRLYLLLNFVISQVEIEEAKAPHDSSRMFAETMLVSIRDLRNHVCDVHGLLQRGIKS